MHFLPLFFYSSGFYALWYCSLALADFAPPLRDWGVGREEENGEKEWRRREQKIHARILLLQGGIGEHT